MWLHLLLFGCAHQSSSCSYCFLAVQYNPAIAAGQWWRLLSAAFLHGGLMHLMVNCYSLSNLGPTTEQLYGSSRFLTVYTLAAISSSSLSYVMSPAPSLGASGEAGAGTPVAFFHGNESMLKN